MSDGLRTTHNLKPGKTHMNYTGNDCAWNPLERIHFHIFPITILFQFIYIILVTCYCLLIEYTEAKNFIATAATNGAVVIWNIVRDGQTRTGKIITSFLHFLKLDNKEKIK